MPPRPKPCPKPRKTCTDCKESKPHSEFATHGSTADKLYPQCRECKRARDRERYRQKREEIKARVLARYHTNPAPVIARSKAWKKKNRAKVRRYDRKYRKANRDKVNSACAKRRARKRAALSPDACPVTIAKIYDLCAALNQRSVRRGGWAVDHTIPLSKGGLHHEDNLQVVPGAWNLEKGNHHSDRWTGKYPPWVYKYCVDIGLELR